MSLEVNKAFAAILTAGITFSVAGLIGDLVVHPHRLEKPAIDVGEAPAASAAPAAAPTLEPVTPLLASASAEEGQKIAQRSCGSCHSFNEGGRAGVGPNLYGVIGGPHAHMEGFNYSNAMKAKHDEVWDYEKVNAFISAPARIIPGTRMAFAGINSAKQRADVVAYLRSISPRAPAP
jgi:cytochrome c